jgi:L-methionine (R)-S-oxide reductase
MTTKEETYQEALKGIKGVIEGETDIIANLSNSAAILKEAFNFWWIGFYIVKNAQLVLGPFQGPVACTRIELGKGVCGTSWMEKQTIIVPDVHQFPGHIACSAASNSEIVVPVIKNGVVIMVLDVDSIHYNEFDEVDKKYLEEIAVILANIF